jgi:hypothetical protein
MTRTIKSVPTGTDNEFKWEVRIEGEDCPALTLASYLAMRSLLQTCLGTPGMMSCGNNTPQSLKMTHDGEKWVIMLEAVGP